MSTDKRYEKLIELLKEWLNEDNEYDLKYFENYRTNIMNELDAWINENVEIQSSSRTMTMKCGFKILQQYHQFLKNIYLEKDDQADHQKVIFDPKALPDGFIESSKFVKQYFFPNSTLCTFLRQQGSEEFALYFKKKGCRSGKWYVHPHKLIEYGIQNSKTSNLKNNFKRAQSLLTLNNCS